MVLHKNFADFVLFLYVHMAFADGSLHQSEEQVILDKMKKLFPGTTDLKARFDAGVKEYNSVKKEEIPGLIRDSFKTFDTVKFAQKYKIYTEMYDIINADGKVEESETEALNSLKDIININAELRHS